MNFTKKGLIFDHESLDISWFKKNAMTPMTVQLDESTIRIFVGMCDKDNIGRIGYVDVDSNDPKIIKGYSKEICFDIGDIGCFDDNGVIPSAVVREGDTLYLLYSGYQKVAKVPYLIFAGIAVSHDMGESFTRLSKAPFLDRADGELAMRAAVNSLKVENGYKIWYLGGSDWIQKNQNQIAPTYDVKYKFFECKSIAEIAKGFSNSSTSMTFMSDDEYGLSMPQVFIEDNIYKMIYSIRTYSKGYRMGYAESQDEGKTWVRKDHLMSLDVSESGWDSEMVCFGHLHKTKNKTYLFYCGNGYGTGGIGYAEVNSK